MHLIATLFPEIIERISCLAEILWDKGWAEWRAGNFSINVIDLITADPARFASFGLGEPDPNEFALIISAAGSRMRDIARHAEPHCAFVLLRPNGGARSLLAGVAPQPTSEIATHVAIHRFLRKHGRTETAILHTHPTPIIALTHRKEYGQDDGIRASVLSMHREAELLHPGGIGFLPYIKAGSQELARATVKALHSVSTVVWQYHGAIAVGADLDDAFDKIDVLAKCAEIYLTTHAQRR
jgi:rhamnulose-1-phosphate aldolase